MLLKPARGQTVELSIQDITHKGEGVGRYHGFIIFVPGALTGERVAARVTEVKKNFGRAELIEVTEPTLDRVEPHCKICNRCGGCQLQHLHYEKQLQWKHKMVEDAMGRIGGLTVKVEPVLGMDNPWYYRNKVQYQAGTVAGKRQLGFYAVGSRDFVPVLHCHLLPEEFTRLIPPINRYLSKYGENVEQVWLRKGLHYGQLMAVIFVQSNLPSDIGTLFEETEMLDSLVVLGKNREQLACFGAESIKESIGSKDFLLSPLSFFQINPVQTGVLYNHVKARAGLTGVENLWDLYCGTGTIGLYLADEAKQLIGVEIEPSAVTDAQENARLNGIDNARFYQGAAEQLLDKLWQEENGDNVVVVDPPRQGCDQRLLDSLLKYQPERIIYVSCNPSTLARDLKRLISRYDIHPIQPVDMFPHTGHVECVVRIQRKKCL